MNDSSIDHVVRLPEQPDSSDDDESPRKRLKSSRPDSPVQVHQRNAEDWDHFVRAGARLKNLATLAMQWNEGPGTTQPEEDEEAIANPASTTLNQQYSHLAKLASEKTAECIVLEKVRFQKRNEFLIWIIIVITITTWYIRVSYSNPSVSNTHRNFMNPSLTPPLSRPPTHRFANLPLQHRNAPNVLWKPFALRERMLRTLVPTQTRPKPRRPAWPRSSMPCAP
jgi:hypothetical protein